jgi:hypothetical protein
VQRASLASEYGTGTGSGSDDVLRLYLASSLKRCAGVSILAELGVDIGNLGIHVGTSLH